MTGCTVTLLQHDAVSQEAYEQVRTELETLKAEIDIVKTQIELTELRAPFDGVIGLRQISVGAYASPTTIVSKLTRIIPLKVEFSVPERYVNEVNPGTALTFTIDGSLQNFPAKVYAKESAIDENTHTLKVRALYENPNGRLTPGRYASINLKKQEIQDAIASIKRIAGGRHANHIRNVAVAHRLTRCTRPRRLREGGRI